MNWSRKTVLVTGGAGLVGSRIVRKLTRLGADIKILDNLSAYPFNQLQHFGVESLEGVQIVTGDIRNRAAVCHALKDVDIVFHEAAFADVAATIWNPSEDFSSNVAGTFNILNAAKENNVERLIFASSASVYGNKSRKHNGEPPVFSKGQRLDPLSTYANSKLWGEYECLLFCKLYGLKTTVLRYFSIYGVPQVPKKGSHSWVIAIFAMRLSRGKPLIIFGDGSQVRDFVYVDDVAEATIHAAEKEALAGEIINIGTGQPTSIIELAHTMTHITGKKVPFKFKPRPKGDPVGGYADITKMEKLLGWKPRVPLKDGIPRYWGWITDNKKLIPDWL